MEKIVPKTINARLYKIVFLVITNASFVANRYLKLLKPHHGLFNIPSFKLIFLKAMMTPALGYNY